MHVYYTCTTQSPAWPCTTQEHYILYNAPVKSGRVTNVNVATQEVLVCSVLYEILYEIFRIS